ncbi:MAG: guanylate kinase [Holosporales bacterium]|jgi:guanylate kinase|nr:guanylate kinase [Holosporales bacterium]
MTFHQEKQCATLEGNIYADEQVWNTASFNKNRSGIIFALSAPSGTGKTTVAQKVVQNIPGLIRSVSLNTRKKRSTEKDGIDYIFVSKEEFDNRIKEGYFIEYTEIYGAKRGTPKDALVQNQQKGIDTICVIEWHGVQTLKKLYGQSVVSIFLMPPSIGALEKRLTLRNQDHINDIQQRLRHANDEVMYVKEYDYCVVNDRLAQCVFDVSSIIFAERHKTFRAKL